MAGSSLHERLASATGRRTYRTIATLTNTNPETVRRYMQGQAPSVEFLTTLCEALGVNSSWLLTGRGPMRQSDVRSHALREANAAELLSAMANTLTELIERVERIEVFVQSLETRLRVAASAPRGVGIIEPSGKVHEREGRTDFDPAERIGGSIAQRPREDAD